jgi:hypothetical protein
VSDHPVCGYAADTPPYKPYKGGDYAAQKSSPKNKKFGISSTEAQRHKENDASNTLWSAHSSSSLPSFDEPAEVFAVDASEDSRWPGVKVDASVGPRSVHFWVSVAQEAGAARLQL